MGQQVVAYFHGLCEPTNPGGYACGGYVVEPFTNAGQGLKGGKCFGNGEGMTNHVADYEAALLVLRVIYETGYRGSVLLKGNNQLMARQFIGECQCNSPLTIPLLKKLKKAAETFQSLTLEWIPKAENHRADEESKLVYTDVTGRKVPVRLKR